jgi:hypothetical protein
MAESERSLNVSVTLDLAEAERQWGAFSQRVTADMSSLQSQVRVGGGAGAQAAAGGGGGGGGGGGAAAAMVGRGAMGMAGMLGLGSLAAAGYATLDAMAPGIGGAAVSTARSTFASTARYLLDGPSERGMGFVADVGAIGRAEQQVSSMLQNAPEVSEQEIYSLLYNYKQLYEPGARNVAQVGIAADSWRAIEAERLINVKWDRAIEDITNNLKAIRAALGGG